MVNVSIPWATVGTSPCRHCSFSVHTDMLGRTTVGWAGHRCVSSHGHKWSFCFMSTAYKLAAFQQLYSVLASSFLALCEWTQSDSVWPVQLMRKHINSCATKSAHLYQHVCHFMYMHQKETYQLMCHEKCAAFQPYVTSCTWTISKHVNSCTTKSAQHINMYVTSRTWTRRKHINSCATKSAQCIKMYVTSCTWTISKHINSCTTKSAQCINTYVTSCTRTIRKHINSCTAKRAQRINTNVTSMKMNSILEIRCIRLFCDSVNCSPSDLNFWILQFERLEDEIFTPVKHFAKIDRASCTIVEKNN